MNVPELCIRRPVMTTLAMSALLFFGIIGYLYLPTSYLPQVDFPTIQVGASMTGASAVTMASTVAAPLESEFSSISGLESMSSSSGQGSTRITLQFSLDRDIDAAAQDVQSAISRAGRRLPEELTTDPNYQKVNPADNPVFYLAMYSETTPLTKVNEYAKTFVTQTLSMVEGVAQVLVYGERKYAVRIQLDPNKLAGLGIGLDDVKKAAASENVNLPMGNLYGPERNPSLEADGQLETAEKYLPLIVSYKNGQPVRLQDLGDVVDSVENNRSGSYYDGQQNIMLAVKRQPGSNTIEVVDRIYEKMDYIREQLPDSIKLAVRYDVSKTIRASVEDVKFTLVLAVGLVVLVVFLFLRTIRSTLIAAAAVPFSIVATFAVMYKLNFSLDNLSLMALTLAVGFVVDDAIVMLENIVRHLEMGKKPFQAALDGSREIGFTIISMTLSLTAVFLPVMFMSGIIGRVLNEFALTITCAILVSGAVSLSLTPMLASRLLKRGARHEESGLFFKTILRWYRWALTKTLDHPLSTMIAAGLLLYATAHVFMLIPKGFLPSVDQGMLTGSTQGAQGLSFPAMAERQNSLTPLLQANPNVDSVFQIVGTGAQNQGMVLVTLKPRKERRKNADQVLRELWPAANSIPGLRVFLQNPPMIRIGGRSSKGDYQFTLLSPDTETLYEHAEAFTEKMKSLPSLMGVNNDLQLDNPQVKFVLNRDQAAALKVNAELIEDALFTAYGSRKISTINTQNDDYAVIMELAPEFQDRPDDLSLLHIRNKDGKLINLDVLTDRIDTTGPLTINHSGQLPSTTISFGLGPGVSIGQAYDQILDLARRELPAAVSYRFEGSADAFKQSMSSVYFLLFLAVVVIYLILGVLYESFLHPLTILSGLPSAALGGLLTLYLFGLDLNLYGFVGIIMLIGIVKKNAIMVVDFAIEAEKAGKSPRDAVFEGSLIRFRPIMMTTVAAIMGAAPIAFAYGADGQARQPLGLVVVGGLLLSQVVTLFLTPVFYTYMARLQGKRIDHAPGEAAAQPVVTDA
ncbi:MAG: efflux RND transporter permease subunit [Pseudomonadota bacterium]